jgi:hypothetical protein
VQAPPNCVGSGQRAKKKQEPQIPRFGPVESHIPASDAIRSVLFCARYQSAATGPCEGPTARCQEIMNRGFCTMLRILEQRFPTPPRVASPSGFPVASNEAFRSRYRRPPGAW